MANLLGMRVGKVFDLPIVSAVIAALCALALPVMAEEQKPAQNLSPTHEKYIIEAFTKPKWDAAKMLAHKLADAPPAKAPSDLDTYWRGNEPTVDIGMERIELIYARETEDKSRHLFHMNVDLSGKKEKFFHSETYLQNFRGGAILEPNSPDELRQFYFPANNQSGMLIFAPPMKRGGDFYFLSCPREIVVRGEGVIGMKNTDIKLYSALVVPFGTIKAFLLTGTSTGKIEASLDRTAIIPPGIEPYDLVETSNPVIEILYRADPSYVVPPMGEEIGSDHKFMVNLEMQLPAGFGRKINEGYAVTVKTVTVPQFNVVTPVTTIRNTPAKNAITSRLEIGRSKQGLNTIVDSGPCSLVVAERTVRQTVLTSK